MNSTYNDEDSTYSLLQDFKNEINLLVSVTDCFVVEVGGCSKNGDGSDGAACCR